MPLCSSKVWYISAIQEVILNGEMGMKGGISSMYNEEHGTSFMYYIPQMPRDRSQFLFIRVFLMNTFYEGGEF